MGILRTVLIVLLAALIGGVVARSTRTERAIEDAQECAAARDIATTYLNACALDLLECRRADEGATF